ncbi:hypothetical protein BDY21DRAFT_270049, partial [Lineolata rhizophorae]
SMSSDDLSEYVDSSHDFYDLLGIATDAGDAEIRRAYRKTALKYHPDKNADNPAAIETFHLLQIAYDLLSDSSVRSQYDAARAARKHRQRQHELLEGKRRQMKEDLERRESFGLKRKRSPESADEEAKLRQLAEDGRRRRKERESMLREEMLREDVRKKQAQTTSESNDKSDDCVSEIDRTVKARWVRDGDLASLTKDELVTMFSAYGQVEGAFLLKDKKQRVRDGRERKLMGTGVVVFASVVSARAAVEDSKRQAEPRLNMMESIVSAASKAADSVERTATSPQSAPQSAPSTPAKPPPFAGLSSMPSTPASSFQSFTPASVKTSSSPSLQEITMMRLRMAEKKRLEEQIRKEEAAE